MSLSFKENGPLATTPRCSAPFVSSVFISLNYWYKQPTAELQWPVLCWWASMWSILFVHGDKWQALNYMLWHLPCVFCLNCPQSLFTWTICHCCIVLLSHWVSFTLILVTFMALFGKSSSASYVIAAGWLFLTSSLQYKSSQKTQTPKSHFLEVFCESSFKEPSVEGQWLLCLTMLGELWYFRSLNDKMIKEGSSQVSLTDSDR